LNKFGPGLQVGGQDVDPVHHGSVHLVEPAYIWDSLTTPLLHISGKIFLIGLVHGPRDGQGQQGVHLGPVGGHIGDNHSNLNLIYISNETYRSWEYSQYNKPLVQVLEQDQDHEDLHLVKPDNVTGLEILQMVKEGQEFLNLDSNDMGNVKGHLLLLPE
jgi:hypothetical protein